MIVSMKCNVAGVSRAADQAVWVPGGGIVIACTYILFGKKMDKFHVRSELQKKAQPKQAASRMNSTAVAMLDVWLKYCTFLLILTTYV